MKCYTTGVSFKWFYYAKDYHDSQNPEYIYDITKAVIQSTQYMIAMRIQAEQLSAASLLPMLVTAPNLMVYGLCNTALSVVGQVLNGIEKVFEIKKAEGED